MRGGKSALTFEHSKNRGITAKNCLICMPWREHYQPGRLKRRALPRFAAARWSVFLFQFNV